MWWRLLPRYLFGLSLMATTLLLMTPPGRAQVATADERGGLTPDTGEAQESLKTEEQSLEDFLRIYRLDRDENLKHVPPPRPEGIRAYWKRERAGFANSPDQFGAMTFRWRDPDRLVNSSMTSGDAGFRVQDLPRYLEMDIFPAEIDGDPDLLKTAVAGDWIYRVGTPAEQMVRALEIRLQRTLRKRITLKLRTVEREVVVVRGQYHSSPVTGRAKDQIEIYGKQIVPGGGGGRRFRHVFGVPEVGRGMDRAAGRERGPATAEESVQLVLQREKPVHRADEPRGSRRAAGVAASP